MGTDDGVLERRAAAGDSAAQIALARQYEQDARHDMARGWFARAAQTGDLTGLRMLGISLLAREPMNVVEGANIVRAAAERGDAEAAHLCAVLAGQDTALPRNWAIAGDFLDRSARFGHGPAKEQQRLLSCVGPALDAARWLSSPTAETAFEAPRIQICKGFATAEECDWMIARARPRLAAAEIYDPSGAGLRAEEIRSNTAASFDIVNLDLVMVLMRARIGRMASLSTDHMEPLSVLHYDIGEQFGEHFDFVPEALAADIARNGQRHATFLVYLNDNYEGGETDFPALGWRYKGRKGDALLFWNVLPDGTPDRRTLHAGLAPTRGEKWLLSQWLRKR
ncbi:MAG TPA: 2OG-Fe(II) oxygenase [Rhizomicrobium sp.]|nr:2OG-Fe(II) oxygenase [Rhizomicrobium sp.]